MFSQGFPPVFQVFSVFPFFLLFLVVSVSSLTRPVRAVVCSAFCCSGCCSGAAVSFSGVAGTLWGPCGVAWDSGPQGFWGPCFGWDSRALQGWGALRGTHSHIILELQGEVGGRVAMDRWSAPLCEPQGTHPLDNLALAPSPPIKLARRSNLSPQICVTSLLHETQLLQLGL